MTGIFDGMAGVLNGVFGAPVIHVPASGPQVSVASLFREVPVDAETPDGGPVVVVVPTWSVQRPYADLVRAGDRVMVADGRWFRVGARYPSGSPAADSFVRFELEEVEPA